MTKNSHLSPSLVIVCSLNKQKECKIDYANILDHWYQKLAIKSNDTIESTLNDTCHDTCALKSHFSFNKCAALPSVERPLSMNPIKWNMRHWNMHFDLFKTFSISKSTRPDTQGRLKPTIHDLTQMPKYSSATFNWLG